MEIKSNEATTLRPEGDRILYAPLVVLDLNKSIEQLKEETTWSNSDRNSITLYKSDNGTMVLIGLHENAELKTHTANGSIHVQVLDGELIFTAEKQPVHLGKGHMIVLQANIPHSVLAKKESFFLLTMMNRD